MDELIAALKALGYPRVWRRYEKSSPTLPVLIVGYDDVAYGGGDKGVFPRYVVTLIHDWDKKDSEERFADYANNLAWNLWKLGTEPGTNYNKWLPGDYGDPPFAGPREFVGGGGATDKEEAKQLGYGGRVVSIQDFYMTHTGWRPEGFEGE